MQDAAPQAIHYDWYGFHSLRKPPVAPILPIIDDVENTFAGQKLQSLQANISTNTH